MILSIKNLSKLRPLENAAGYRLVVPELDVRAGEKILITGPSGSGKSTFLDLLGMVLKPDRAERFLFSPGKENAALDVAGAWVAGHREDLARWRRSVGYVLQTGGLLPFLSVRENILTPRRLMGLQDDGTLENLAHTLNIEHLLDNLPQRLSVGERQRAAIARALAAKPALVLADEPTAALDPLNAQSVLAMFSDMVSRLGITLILVTHAPEQMKGMGFRRFAVTQNTGPERVREATLQEAVTGESI